MNQRLGLEYSEANVIAYPRMLDVLVFTCLATVVSDHRWWLRLSAAGLLVLPAMVALATAGRGALAALLVASVLCLSAQRHAVPTWFTVAVGAFLLVLGYWAVDTFLPLMRDRISNGDDSGRSIIYLASLSNVSVLGTGNKLYYPHNLFLEFAENYGIIGLAFLLVFLLSSFNVALRLYSRTHDPDVLWVIGLMVFQLLAQQFSLNIFQNMLWAALLLPVGLAAPGSSIQRFPRRLALEYGLEDPLLPLR
jgi:O-antigen ligase